MQDILRMDSPDSTAYKGIKQYLLVVAFTEEKLDGKTYRDILELYQLWDIQDKTRRVRVESQAELEEEENRKRSEELPKVVDVSLREITAQYTDSIVQFHYSIAISNKSGRKVKAISGYLQQFTATGGTVLPLSFTFKEPLLPRKTRTEVVSTLEKKISGWNRSPFSAGRSKEKVIWKLEAIDFEE
ncbi:hypothetical protein [Telluribacter sp.]|jgi:hypothetical protein|uniref:hypothetical protein n=1 Tax=Telluribacter sp. TaxID=1978767 RepID=UPI002E103E5E|nr:hypothetical protein [Telluribacter sp.]